ncbi:hypothetical protein CF70_018295 [Cupriavidus sp. SK-3]|nr:hypothetical protein CF70_018295 [Cupriavidus sp. SK-3]
MAGVLPAGGYADPGGTSEIVSENDIIALQLMGMQGDPAPRDTPQYARITTHRLALPAERTYLDPDVPRLLWFHDIVQHDIGARAPEGYVALPPTRWDWIRAKLP